MTFILSKISEDANKKVKTVISDNSEKKKGDKKKGDRCIFTRAGTFRANDMVQKMLKRENKFYNNTETRKHVYMFWVFFYPRGAERVDCLNTEDEQSLRRNLSL